MNDFMIVVSSNLERARAGFERAPARMNQLIEFAIEQGARTIAADARKNAPTAFTNLRQSINAHRMGDLHWQVRPGVDHAIPVELGTKGGGWVPIDAITRWIALKHITPKKPGVSQRDLPYMIRRAIFTHGSKPQPFMRPAAERSRDRVFQLVDQAVDKGLAEIFA